MDKEILDKIQAVKDEYDEDSQIDFDQWIKDLEEIEAAKELKKHFIIQEMVERMKAQVEAMRTKLARVISLSGIQDDRAEYLARHILLIKCELYENFINIFDNDDRERGIKDKIKSL